MMTRNSALDKFLLSRKFIVCIIVLQFILLPIATKGFRWENIGDLIIYTLSPCTYTRDVSLCVDFSRLFPCHADAACASARDDVALVYVFMWEVAMCCMPLYRMWQ